MYNFSLNYEYSHLKIFYTTITHIKMKIFQKTDERIQIMLLHVRLRIG